MLSRKHFEVLLRKAIENILVPLFGSEWLKDRKGMTLRFEDVKHYQRIIYVLQQTERIMQEINGIMAEQKN